MDSVVFDIQWRKDDNRIVVGFLSTQKRADSLRKAAAGEIVTIYNVETASSIHQFSGHKAAVKSIAWDPGNDCE